MKSADRVPLNPDMPAWSQLQEQLDQDIETPCQSHPDLWFSSTSVRDTRQAVQLCETECKLRDLCRQAGLERNEKYGVWGGLSSPDGHKLEDPGAEVADQGMLD